MLGIRTQKPPVACGWFTRVIGALGIGPTARFIDSDTPEILLLALGAPKDLGHPRPTRSGATRTFAHTLESSTKWGKFRQTLEEASIAIKVSHNSDDDGSSQ